ncbi:probable protein phosphatase 2C 8 isoform X2 [Eucalyptus grandis]|uniref:probable protein phosphatase 2C 8 isoform X2 n=1 Tax=Eucalyptus grandis TaxID=71139 RepID=UPI00192E87C7|nr:probable protein phosphatase 2C 8 isoform X2 [Eucalyptus grandis]XP_039164435.1 probable protein phosphatase 2C 8 isoform X2 [Eucalyptus grandis]XP_039164436.1 probable protein phosphatase 2C 8 isoform X2 [Eucalyptus grandis]XP_039164437.1 probable protein phosphatase 2C 8 isoform X2 [Eucalyptus grandis]XP_039164438.1 probable protein phosphatase 2C 8 isoform X2 [Eucalyptus grandis]
MGMWDFINQMALMMDFIRCFYAWNVGFQLQWLLQQVLRDYCLKQYVMAEPEATVSKRTELDDILVIASDGLWDALSNEAACQVVRRCLDRYIKRRFPEELRGSNAVKVAAVLAKLAMSRDSQDNINVIMVELKKPN